MRFGETIHSDVTLRSTLTSDLRHINPFLGSAVELQLKFGMQVG